MLQSFLAYSSAFTGGVFVAVGDVNNDGFADIITGAAQAVGRTSRCLAAPIIALLESFFAYSANFKGGVRVAAGDVNGDRFADIVTGAGTGGGPHVEVFSGENLSLLQSIIAFDPKFTGGVYVAAGDVDAEGHADVIVGAGEGGGPQVKVYCRAERLAAQEFLCLRFEFPRRRAGRSRRYGWRRQGRHHHRRWPRRRTTCQSHGGR